VKTRARVISIDYSVVPRDKERQDVPLGNFKSTADARPPFGLLLSPRDVRAQQQRVQLSN
jgi:hypothetical protein